MTNPILSTNVVTTNAETTTWPVAVFVFARPNQTAKLLETLKVSEGADRIHLFVFADGPRNAADTDKTDATLQVVQAAMADHPFRNVTVTAAKSNRGLANSVIAGVTQILDHYSSVIVLEDDLTISRVAIAYLAAALEQYENDPRVFSVTAYNYPEKVIHAANLPHKDENFFLHRPCSWAWGTWRQPWQDTQWDGEIYDTFLKDATLQENFKQACGYDVTRMLRKQLSGKIDSWAIRFTYSCFLKDGLVSYPARSFVSNTGSRGDGTHKGNNSKWIEHEALSNDFNPAAFGEAEISRTQLQQFKRFTRRRFLFRRAWGETQNFVRRLGRS